MAAKCSKYTHNKEKDKKEVVESYSCAFLILPKCCPCLLIPHWKLSHQHQILPSLVMLTCSCSVCWSSVLSDYPSLLFWNGAVCQDRHGFACGVGDQCQFPTRALYLAGKGTGWPSLTATDCTDTLLWTPILVHLLPVSFLSVCGVSWCYLCFLLKRRWVINTFFSCSVSAYCLFLYCVFKYQHPHTAITDWPAVWLCCVAMELSSVAYWEYSLVISEVAIRGDHVPVWGARAQTGPEQSWPAGERGFSDGPWLHRLCNHRGGRWHQRSCPYSLHRSPAPRRRRTPHPLPHLLQALASSLPGCEGEHRLPHAREHLGRALLPPCPWGAAQGAGLECGVVSVCAGWPDGTALPREGHGGGPATA